MKECLGTMRQTKKAFPISQIRGKRVVGENVLKKRLEQNATYSGLVDDMAMYEKDLNLNTLSPTIRHFYEYTNEYHLLASVNWHSWFKPFAAVYRLISRKILQINLPLSNKEVEMTGDILSVKDEVDGRRDTRAWIRKVNGEVCFVALYSSHQTKGRTYMNIGLPLPGSIMTGILELNQYGSSLGLSSSKKKDVEADSGTYLSTKRNRYKLPIEEEFLVEELASGGLKAVHDMRIFSLPFLTIHYAIYHESNSPKNNKML